MAGVNDDEIRKQEEESFGHAMQLASSLVLSMSMQSATELGVFDIIAKAGPGAELSSSEIADQIGARNPDAPAMLDRILRLLTTHSLLKCSLVDKGSSGNKFQRLYSLTPVSNYFVKNGDGSLCSLMALNQDKVFIDAWSGVKDAIVEGGSAYHRVHGIPVFEYLKLDTRLNQVFNTAMFNQTNIAIQKILNVYKGLENLTRLVDVGGGFGVNLSVITSRYPYIQGINFDQPHVIKHAPSYPGVEHVGGDMFTSVPSGDAILMKWILHDWSDEQCIKLLKNCYKGIPEDGKVIVVEALLPAMPESGNGVKSTSQLDVLMMTHFQGGKERSREEFMDLATAAGFSGIRFECFVCNFWVMEFFKN